MLVEAISLAHRFTHEARLFSNISFALDEGQMLGVAGPSGSGKSTLLAIVAGWLTPAEGSICRASDLRCTWVPQNPYGVARRTVIDQVALALLIEGHEERAARSTAAEALDRFGLARVARQQFRSLSGGEAQRFMLARASITRAQLILVDEPTAQLDRRNASAVAEVMQELTAYGRAVVVASHDHAVLSQCPKVIDLALR